MRQFKITTVYKETKLIDLIVEASSQSEAETKAFDYVDKMLDGYVYQYEPMQVELYFRDEIRHRVLFGDMGQFKTKIII